MKILRRFAPKDGPSNGLVVAWDEEALCLVFSREDEEGECFRMLPDTLKVIYHMVFHPDHGYA